MVFISGTRKSIRKSNLFINMELLQEYHKVKKMFIILSLHISKKVHCVYFY